MLKAIKVMRMNYVGQVLGGRFIVCAALCFMLAVPSSAYDYTLFFGANYSGTIADGDMSHGLGANVAEIIEFDRGLNLFASIGFTAGLSGRNDLLTSDLKALGVDGLDSTAFTIPMRIGYPVLFDATEKLRIAFIPSFAFDILFFSSNFTQSVDYYGTTTTYKYDLSGWGYSMGFSANLGVQHKFGRVCLWYGVDFEMPLVTFAFIDGARKYAIEDGTRTRIITDASITTPADYFTITVSPFVCAGFSL